jgi:hypothetical protein
LETRVLNFQITYAVIRRLPKRFRLSSKGNPYTLLFMRRIQTAGKKRYLMELVE